MTDDYEGIPHKCDFGCGAEVERHNQACDPCLVSNAEACGDWDEDAAHALARVRTQELQERVKALEAGLQECSDALLMVELWRDAKHRNKSIHDPRLVIKVEPKYVWPKVKSAIFEARALLAPPISEAHAHLLTNPD